MSFLVLGASGMLGHQVCRTISCCVTPKRIYGTLSPYRYDNQKHINKIKQLSPCSDFIRFDAFCDDVSILFKGNPKVIVNCIGLINQSPTYKLADKDYIYAINAEFPHKLAHEAKKRGVRVVHISTDCVFSGNKGLYSEYDTPDSDTIYGMSKAQGEPLEYNNVLVLRTSFYGPEIFYKGSLFEWVKSQKGKTINGYADCIFNGSSTTWVSMLISDICVKNQGLTGLYHFGIFPYSKYFLLKTINWAFDLGITIVKDKKVKFNKALFCEKLMVDMPDAIRYIYATAVQTVEHMKYMYRKKLEAYNL